jgi:hypothetical protein
LAFGHARDITENLRIGAKLKPLIGVADARLKFDDVPFHTEEWIYTLGAKASASVLGNVVQILKKSDGGDSIVFGAPDDLMDLIGGYGIALDLGVSYNLDNLLENTLGALVPFSLKGFTASFGITDIGFIRYKKAERMTFGKTFVWEGGLISTGDELFNTDEFTDQFKDLLDDFILDGNAKRARGLRTTTNAGLEYSFLNNKMSAGLLWSAHWGLPRVFNEWTLSYNLRPTNWFALTLSTSVAHGFFRSAGWAINLTPKYGLALFVGMDYVPLFWTPKIDNMKVMGNEINLDWGAPFGLPIYSTNLNFNFGMSIPLGGNRYHKFPSRRELRNRTMEVDTSTSEVEES